jgi:hypothetical protein
MDRFTDRIHRIFLAVALSAIAFTSSAVQAASPGQAAEAPERMVEVAGVPLFPLLPPRAGVTPRIADLATQIIVRWEVGSEARYTRLYRGVLWPGGASGPTWGIGYDGGHQSAASIERDWSAHPSRQALSLTSGFTGQRAGANISRWRGITTPFSYAIQVFSDRSLPAYAQQAHRTLGRDLAGMPEPAQASLISLGYNRGWRMTGHRNREKRVIRDVCLPRRDTACIAEQLRSMCRINAGTAVANGVCARRKDEARLAVRA